MFIILIYLFSEIFPGVSRGPICSSCTRARSPVWPPLIYAQFIVKERGLQLAIFHLDWNRGYEGGLSTRYRVKMCNFANIIPKYYERYFLLILEFVGRP